MIKDPATIFIVVDDDTAYPPAVVDELNRLLKDTPNLKMVLTPAEADVVMSSTKKGGNYHILFTIAGHLVEETPSAKDNGEDTNSDT